MTNKPLDDVRLGVLARMERGAKLVRIAVISGAIVEAGLLAFAILSVDWKQPLQVQLFVFSILGYTIVILGLLALAGHMNRTIGRVLSALEARE